MKTVETIATSIVETLQDAGHIAYFAGGWVRDFLMKHPSDDIDIATSATTDEIIQLFPKTVPVGIAFGIIVVISEGHSFEVATFRKEEGSADGRRPAKVERASPQEDALRRDFTINGMFYDPLARKLYDFSKGQQDIVAKKIRAIGNPDERFQEDRLRMMRAARYAVRFGFSIEEKTEEAILKHAQDLFPSVAIERVMQEFKKMAQFAHFDTSLLLLHKLSLLGVIFPELKKTPISEIEHRLKPLRDYPEGIPTMIPLLALLPKSTHLEKIALCETLKVSNEDKDFVLFFHHVQEMVRMPEEWQNSLEPIEWARVYADERSSLVLETLKAHLVPEHTPSFSQTHSARREKLRESIARIKHKKPALTAEHLFKEGLKEGKLLGELLKEGEKISVREGLFEADLIIAKLKKLPIWP